MMNLVPTPNSASASACARAYLALLLTFCMTSTTVVGQMADYNKVKRSGRQIQNWKTDVAIPSINNAKSQANNVEGRMHNHNASIITALANVDTTVRVLEESVELVIEKLEALSAAFSQPPDYEAPESAFNAVMTSTGSSLYVTSSTVIKYHSIKLNDGTDYSSSTGHYTAPVSGVYWFFINFHVSSNPDAEAWVKVLRAADSSIENIGYLWNRYDYQTAVMPTVHLLAGDKVYVNPKFPLNRSWSITVGEDNSFMGYLMAADNVEGTSTTSTAAAAATTAAATTAAATTAAATSAAPTTAAATTSS